MSEFLRALTHRKPVLMTYGRGDHSPSYIYRIIKEAYDEEDIDL